MSGEKRINTKLFGNATSFPYKERLVGYALVLGRFTMGWILLQAGLVKLFDPNWTAAGYLTHAISPDNPFATLFLSLAGSPVIDWLVIWGLTLTGVGVLFGAALRFNAFWAAVIMLSFWASHLQGGLMQGFPVEHGWFMTEHLVYAALLMGLASFGAGQVFGVDGWLRQQECVKKHPWLDNLLG